MAKKKTAKHAKSSSRRSNSASSKSAPKKRTSKSPSASRKQQPAKDAEVTIDRRRKNRRAEDSEANGDAGDTPAPKLERRKKVQRRRQIDPTTCERDYSEPEVEFMNAMDEYKRTSGRMFPTCSEVLEVIRNLGYVQLSEAELISLGRGPTVQTEPADESSDHEADASAELELAEA